VFAYLLSARRLMVTVSVWSKLLMAASAPLELCKAAVKLIASSSEVFLVLGRTDFLLLKSKVCFSSEDYFFARPGRLYRVEANLLRVYGLKLA
jgi:hypothetical protein